MMKRILLVLWLATLSAFGAAVVTPAGQGTNNGFWYGQVITAPNITAAPFTNPTPQWSHPSIGTHNWYFYDKLDNGRKRLRSLIGVRESISDPTTRALYLGDSSVDSAGFEGFNGLALNVRDSASGNTDPRIAMVFGDTYGFRFRETNMVTYGGGVHDVELFFFDSLNHNDVVVGPREPRGALAERGGTLLIRGTNIFFTNNIAGTVPVRIFNNGDVRVTGLAGVGTRHVGADADGDLVIVSDGGGGWTGDPNQFSAPAAGTNIIVGALLTNIVIWKTGGGDSLSADFDTTRTLYDDNSDPSVAWGIGVLRAQNVESIDWSGRALKDGAGVVSANWHNRTLTDSSGTGNSVDWNARKLYRSDGITEALDWDASVSIIGGKVFIDDEGLTRITNALIIHSNGVPHITNLFQVATTTNGNSFSINTNGDVYNKSRYIATNDTAANLITVISNSMIYLTNGSAARWAMVGYNTTMSGTNISPYQATTTKDMNLGIITGFRLDDTFGANSVVFENPAGTIQSHLRANRILAGDRLQTYGGLWIGTNATEQLIITGPDAGAGAENLHWANRLVVTNQTHFGTNNLDGPGSTPTYAWGTNYHNYALPLNSLVWSISGGVAAGTPTGEIYHWVPTIMRSSLLVGSNTTAAGNGTIYSTNLVQIASDDNQKAFEVNKVIGKAFFGVPTTFQAPVTNGVGSYIRFAGGWHVDGVNNRIVDGAGIDYRAFSGFFTQGDATAPLGKANNRWTWLHVANGVTNGAAANGAGLGFGTSGLVTSAGQIRATNGFMLQVVTDTLDRTVLASDDVVLINGATKTATLPTAVGIGGKTYTIKLIASATTATVATTSSQTIDGSTTYSLSAQYKYVRVVSDNANWHIIANN